MLWFNFILGLDFIFLCFDVWQYTMMSLEQRKIKLKPRIKLNHNMDTRLRLPRTKTFSFELQLQLQRGTREEEGGFPAVKRFKVRFVNAKQKNQY